jgi:hypothetical protein
MKFFNSVLVLFSAVIIFSCSSDDEASGHPREDIFGNYSSIQFDTLPNDIYPTHNGVYIVPMHGERTNIKLIDAIDSISDLAEDFINETGWQKEVSFGVDSQENGLYTWATWSDDYSGFVKPNGKFIKIETYDNDLILIEPSSVDSLPSIKQYFLKQ